jgi:hypothetical protein
MNLTLLQLTEEANTKAPARYPLLYGNLFCYKWGEGAQLSTAGGGSLDAILQGVPRALPGNTAEVRTHQTVEPRGSYMEGSTRRMPISNPHDEISFK